MVNKEEMSKRWSDDCKFVSHRLDYVLAGMINHADFADTKAGRNCLGDVASIINKLDKLALMLEVMSKE